MKGLFFLLAFTAVSFANAQDYCKQIKKDVSPDKKIVDYSSPADAQEVTNIRLTRSLNLDPDYESDMFLMTFQIVGELEGMYAKSAEGVQEEKEEWKLMVEFEDKSKWTDDTIKLSHDVTSDKMQAIRIVFFNLTEPSIKEFSTKRITRFTLAGFEKAITPEYGNAIMHYVQCMKGIK